MESEIWQEKIKTQQQFLGENQNTKSLRLTEHTKVALCARVNEIMEWNKYIVGNIVLYDGYYSKIKRAESKTAKN